MEAILCDSMMRQRYYAMANGEDKEKFDEYAKAIIKNLVLRQKCQI